MGGCKSYSSAARPLDSTSFDENRAFLLLLYRKSRARKHLLDLIDYNQSLRNGVRSAGSVAKPHAPLDKNVFLTREFHDLRNSTGSVHANPYTWQHALLKPNT